MTHYATLGLQRSRLQKDTISVAQARCAQGPWRLWFAIIITLCLFWMPRAGMASPSGLITLTNDTAVRPLGLSLQILEDPSRKLTIENLVSPSFEGHFHDSEALVPSFGFSPSAYWARVRLKNSSGAPGHWVLLHSYAPLQHVDVYAITRDGTIQSLRGGMGTPYADRPVPYHRHAFPLELDKDELLTVFVRIDGESSKNFNMSIQSQEAFVQHAKQETATFGVFSGMLISLILYNLFVFITLRDLSYLFYVNFLVTSLLFQLSLNGLAQAWLAAEHAFFGTKLIPLTLSLFTTFGIFFTAYFLDSRTRLPRMHLLISVAAVVAAINCILVFFASYKTSMVVVTALGVPMPFIIIGMGVIASIEKQPSALYFTFAWFIMMAGILMQSLRAFGVIETNVITENAMLWGSCAEAILLSLALASRMRTMKEQRQQALLVAAEANEEAMASRQLALANQKKALEQQKITLEAERQLVEKEKMANLGLLSAGVAHEINNPNNFLMMGAQNAESRINGLRDFLYDLMGDERDAEISAAIDKRFEDIQAQMALVKEGSGRIATIVKSMRSASRAEESDQQFFDPVESLLVTLELIKPTFATLTDFDVSNLASRGIIKGSASKLNQVFTNLIVNACHAIEEKQRREAHSEKGTIRLSSHLDNGKLILSIEDNGCGMSNETKARLFQPFFTTKGSDRGTGLGLGICRSIIAEHDGSLEVESTEGRGSVFRVILPSSPVTP